MIRLPVTEGRWSVRALVVGTEPSSVDEAARQLVSAGHSAVRCHDPGTAAFPCLALREGRGCPLEEGPVDVVVTVRDRARPTPSGYEAGVSCGLRRRVPLLVAGCTRSHPFDRWSSRVLERDEDLVAACEQVAAASSPVHAQLAGRAAEGVLAAAGVEAGCDAVVRRRSGSLTAEVVVPPGGRRFEGMIAARVTAALRRFDRSATAIDVAVTARSGDEEKLVR